MEPFRRDDRERRRPPDVGREHLGQAWSEPVDRGVARGVAKRQDRKRDRLARAARLQWRPADEPLAQRDADSRDDDGRQCDGDPFRGQRREDPALALAGTASHPLRFLRRERANRMAIGVEPVEILDQLGHRLIPIRAIGLEAVGDDVLDGLGNRRVHRANRRRRVLHARHELGQLARCGPCLPAPDQHVGQNQPEGIDVGALIGLFAPGLLGRHVRKRAHDHAGDRAPGRVDGSRDAEVHDDGVAVGIDHDVGRLQIAVHHTGFVRGGKTGRDLSRDPERARHRELAFALEDRRQIGARDVGHRDVLDASEFAHVVNADDVPVRDLAGQQQLALEAAMQLFGRPRLRGGFRPNDLEGDRHGQLLIPRVVHLAHSARAEQLDDLIPRAEGLSGHESAGAGRGRDRAGVRRLRQVLLGGLPDVAQLCRKRTRTRAVVSGRRRISRDGCGDRRGDAGRDRGAADRAAAARRRRIACAAGADHRNWDYGPKTAASGSVGQSPAARGEEGKLPMGAIEILGMKLKDRIVIITGATSGIGP